MKAFFEKGRDGDERLEVRKNEDYFFPPHFHNNIEILVCAEAPQSVIYNGTNYRLSAGDTLFCDSYALHAYDRAITQNNNTLLIVPARFTAKFNERNKGMKPREPIISDRDLCARLSDIADKYMLHESNENVRCAACELFLALLESRLTFVPHKDKNETQLIRALLSYLAEHFREDVSLPRLAKDFGYAEAHISRVFHRYTNTGIPAYLNRLRLTDVETRQKNEPSADLTQLIFDSGFKSVPTYYRAKAQNAAKNVLDRPQS